MGLEVLPLEILMMICDYLDIKSKQSFFEAGPFARGIVSSQGVIKCLNMSMNTLATVHTLKTDFFKAIAGYLVEINMCGVVDLCKTALMPAMKRMKTLRSIDISYTKIDLLDFLELYAVCPTLTKICINFRFDKPVTQDPEVLIKNCQGIFKNMKSVQFVGTTTDLLYSVVAEYMLMNADLNDVTFTVLERKPLYQIIYDKQFEEILNCKEFHVFFMNLEVNYGMLDQMGAFQWIIQSRDMFEYIAICNGAFIGETAVYITPIFYDFFRSKFGIKPKCYTEFNNDLSGNVLMMSFNKERVRFDEKFFTSLFHKVKYHFPIYFPPYTQTPVPRHLDWFYTSPVVPPELRNRVTSEYDFKKKRTANPHFVLDFDAAFKTKNKVKLTLSFTVNYVNPVSLTPNSDFLSKLTFLSLSGTVRYSIEFFNVLFRSCVNLETFDIVAPTISPCAAPISRSLPLSKTLRNIRVIDRRFDYKTFFNALSQCKTIENIHILDRSSENTSLADPTMIFKNCENLYNVCIKAYMTNVTKSRMTTVFSTIKSAMGKPHVEVELCPIFLTHDRDGFNYDPYIDVFNVYPIRPGLNWD